MKVTGLLRNGKRVDIGDQFIGLVSRKNYEEWLAVRRLGQEHHVNRKVFIAMAAANYTAD